MVESQPFFLGWGETTPLDFYAGFESAIIDPIAVNEEMSTALSTPAYGGKQGPKLSGFWRWHADNFVMRCKTLLEIRAQKALYGAAPYIPMVDQKNWESVIMAYIDRVLGVAATLLPNFTQFPAMMTAAAAIYAKANFFEWAVGNWPIDTGNYLNRVVNSIRALVQNDTITLSYTYDGVLNRSGRSYVPFVEQRHQINARAALALQDCLQRGINDARIALEGAI